MMRIEQFILSSSINCHMVCSFSPSFSISRHHHQNMAGCFIQILNDLLHNVFGYGCSNWLFSSKPFLINLTFNHISKHRPVSVLCKCKELNVKFYAQITTKILKTYFTIFCSTSQYYELCKHLESQFK